MRILFIHNRYRLPGGEDLAVDLEAALLRDNGHEVETLLFDNESVSAAQGKWAALKMAIHNPGSAQVVTDAMMRFRPEVVHVHNLFFAASPSVLDAAARAGIPVVMTLHNYRLICCNAIMMRDGKPCEICRNSTLPLAGIRYKCYRNSAAASAMVTAVTGMHKIRHTWRDKVSAYISLTAFAAEKFAQSSVQLPSDRIHVLPNFVHDLPGTTGTAPTVVDAGDRAPFFLFAGRLTLEKGILPLVTAFRRMPHLPLVVAGDGPDRAAMESLAAGAPNISFLGAVPREQLMQLMQRCRALLFPSIWYEGLPYVILESFCAGTPVIASRLGAMQSLIEDGINGLHFTPGSADDLMLVVDRFLSVGKPLYAGARRCWEMKFGPANHYQNLMKIYSGILRTV